MKPQQNPKQRPRGRSNNGGSGGGGGGGGGGNGGKGRMPPRNTTFDSNGPDIRIRGNAHQVLEKYLAMARDASSQGDRIAAENYFQHAEHYFRVINNQTQNNGGRPQGPRLTSTPADDQGPLSDEDGDDGENNSSASHASNGNGNANRNANGDEDGDEDGNRGEGQAEVLNA